MSEEHISCRLDDRMECPAQSTASNAELPTRIGPLTESRMTRPTDLGTIGILMVSTNAVSHVADAAFGPAYRLAPQLRIAFLQLL